MLGTKDIINLLVDFQDDSIEYKATDYIKYFNKFFPRYDEWMRNSSLQARYYQIIFGNIYVKSNISIKRKIRETLSGKKLIDISLLIDDRKKWSRRIDENQVIRNDTNILEYAILLTTTLAKRLRDSQLSSFEAYTTLLTILAQNINLSLSDIVISKLCPYNFSKEYHDWYSLITSEVSTDFNKFPINSYDILCSFLFLALWHINRPNSDLSDRLLLFDQWHTFVIECADNKKGILRNKTDEDVKWILQNVLKNGQNNKTAADSSMDSGDNGLYRDKKFLRQSNLYQSVDFKAIEKVLYESKKKDLIVLDLGCGDGEVTCSRFGICTNFKKVIAIDKDQEQIDTAKNKAREKGLENKISFICLDMNSETFIESLDKLFSDNNLLGADIIFAALSLHSTNEPDVVIEKLSEEILNEGGYFIIREVDDDTKIYYSSDNSSTNYLTEAADEYKKIFGFTDRNCARKMYSWLNSSGLKNIELFYDVVDTCNKSHIEKNDIFNIMAGFRKARAEKELANKNKNTYENYEKFEESCRKIISSNDNLLKLFQKPDFWFCAVNYIAIAQKPRTSSIRFESRLSKDIEILLIRHAEGSFDENNLSYNINETGYKQIEQLSEYMKNIRIDNIFCSSMERAIETARPIAEAHGLELKIYEELNEIDRGDVITDAKWGIYNDYYNLWKQHNDDLEFPNGENGESVWLRAKYIIDTIIDDAKKQKDGDLYRACIVTHAGTLRSLLCGLLGIPQSSRYQIIEQFDNCSITTIRVNCNEWSNVNTSKPFVMQSLNDTSYRKGIR